MHEASTLSHQIPGLMSHVAQLAELDRLSSQEKAYAQLRLLKGKAAFREKYGTTARFLEKAKPGVRYSRDDIKRMTNTTSNHSSSLVMKEAKLIRVTEGRLVFYTLPEK